MIELVKQLKPFDRKEAITKWRPYLTDLEFELLCRILLERDECWLASKRGKTLVEKAGHIARESHYTYTKSAYQLIYKQCNSKIIEYIKRLSGDKRDEAMDEVDKLVNEHVIIMSDGTYLVLHYPLEELIWKSFTSYQTSKKT